VPTAPADVAARFRTLLDLYDVSAALMRQNLRRRHPQEGDEEIEARLHRWLAKADEREATPWKVRTRLST
jgi:hypothetical protein